MAILDDAKDRLGDAAAWVEDTAEDIGARTKDVAEDMTEKAKDVAGDVTEKAKANARTTWARRSAIARRMRAAGPRTGSTTCGQTARSRRHGSRSARST